MTNGVVVPFQQHTPNTYSQETKRFQGAALHKVEKADLSFTGGDGRGFNVSISRETTVYAATYDRRAELTHGGGRGRSARHGNLRKGIKKLGHELKDLRHDLKGVRKGLRKELKEDFKDLRHDLKDLRKDLREASGRDRVELRKDFREMRRAVKAFKKLLHRSLKQREPERAEPFRAAEVRGPGPSFRETHVEVVAVSETVTIEMDGAVDPAYWSAESTAGRLFDFAAGSFQGEDRERHAEKMFVAMEQGFQETANAFGGVLPGIVRETVDLAEEMLARWAAEDDEGEVAERLDLVA